MTSAVNTSLAEQEVLLQNLQRAELFAHPVERFELLQTHISWVLLTGPFAYKFKKPVNLGFLDFSTLALRKHFCEEELRLNRRLAPQLYLEVIRINGDWDRPTINGAGKTIEYAVKMQQFPQTAQLDVVLSNQRLTPQHIDSLADAIAAFHLDAEQAERQSPYGDAESVLQPVLENFAHIRQVGALGSYESRLKKLEDWCHAEFENIRDLLTARKKKGFIREGHGDMHLRNMALLDNRVVLFDCLEFNPALRWIDVMNDLAFLLMDLDDRKQSPLAWRCLNRYLQHTGDYAGIKLLGFYKVYRALVRAKVDGIRLSQPHLTQEEQGKTLDDFLSYLALAESYTEPGQASLIITRGLSASGKTSYTQPLLEAMGAIRLRSDVERKRLFEKNDKLYSTDTTQQVYRHLLTLAHELLGSAYPVIVDATFIDAENITPFHDLATRMDIPFHILEFHAKPDTLRHRIKQRQADYSDATLEVLENQLTKWQAVPEALQADLISLDTEQDINIEELKGKLIQHVCNRATSAYPGNRFSRL